MAENKNSFIGYYDWGDTFDELSDEEAGKLIKHLFNSVRGKDTDPDSLTKLLFIPFQQTLKRDLKKYETYVEKQKANGSKGGRPKKTKEPNPLIEKPKEPNPFLKKPTKPKKADSVIASVSDNVIVNANVSAIDNVTVKKTTSKEVKPEPDLFPEIKKKQPIQNKSPKLDMRNTDINEVENWFKIELDRTGSKADLEKHVRGAANHILNQLKKQFPEGNALENAKMLITAALNDSFHHTNATTLAYIYKHMQKIANSSKKQTTHAYERQVGSAVHQARQQREAERNKNKTSG